jgi:hypothetical protein
MGPIHSPETSVLNQLTPRNNPENGRNEFNCDGGLRSRTVVAFAVFVIMLSDFFEVSFHLPSEVLWFSFVQQHNRNPYIQERKYFNFPSSPYTRFTHFGTMEWSSHFVPNVERTVRVGERSPKRQWSSLPSVCLSAPRGGTRRRLLGWSAAGLPVSASWAAVVTNEAARAVGLSPSLTKYRSSRSKPFINSPYTFSQTH